MTDLVITAANVLPGEGANLEYGLAGATITAGKAVYLAEATGRYGLADNNAASPPEIKTVRGIALNGASDGQPCTILRSGEITIGATLVGGDAYYLSDTAGGICPRADLLTGESVIQVGLARSTTVLIVNIQATGFTV